jgi:hypothetical protein
MVLLTTMVYMDVMGAVMSNLEDASFRTFGRPKEPDKRRVSPSKMQAIERSETLLYFVKWCVWADDVPGQQKYMAELMLAMIPLMEEINERR